MASIILFFVDILWVAGFATVLLVVKRLVELGKFDWLKIPFSRNSNKKTVTVDKAAWAGYGNAVICVLTILYAFYRFFYQ